MAEAALDDVFVDDITFPAADGYLLAATPVLCRAATERNAVLINSAAAVPRKIYRGFAGYLARRGCAVLTYDYRGIGGFPAEAAATTSRNRWSASRPRCRTGPRKMRPARWPGCASATTPCRSSYVGHSFGGQALGLLPNNDQSVARAADRGASRLLEADCRRPSATASSPCCNFVGVPLAQLLGYAPGWLGLGEDMPKGVFVQWARWVDQSALLSSTIAILVALANFTQLPAPMMALCISDDPWATLPAVELLVLRLHHTSPEIVTVTPAETGVGGSAISDFSEPTYRDTLWKKAADWLTGTAMTCSGSDARSTAYAAASGRARERRAHGDEFFGGGGMHRHGRIEVRLGRLHLHRDADDLDQFAGFRLRRYGIRAPGRSRHRRSVSSACGCRARTTSPSSAGTRPCRRRRGCSCRSRLRFGEPDGADFRLREHRGRNVGVVDHRRPVAEHGVGEGVPLADRHRRQIDAMGDIAHRIDMRHRASRMRVDRNAAIVRVDGDAGVSRPRLATFGCRPMANIT